MIRKYRSELTEYDLGIMERHSVGKIAILLNPGPRGMGSVVQGVPRLTTMPSGMRCAAVSLANPGPQAPGSVLLHMCLTELYREGVRSPIYR